MTCIWITHLDLTNINILLLNFFKLVYTASNWVMIVELAWFKVQLKMVSGAKSFKTGQDFS